MRVTGGPERMHAVAFRHEEKNRLLVAVTNDFSWVQPVNDDGKVTGAAPPPPPCKGVELVIKADRVPAKVLEAVSGKALRPEAVTGGYRVRLPEFQTMALVVAEE